MKINSQVIFYMLQGYFEVLKTETYSSIGNSWSSDEINMLADILVRGVKKQLSKGLMKNYKQEQELLTTIRGSIDVNQSIKDFSLERRKIWCSYDEYSVDCSSNRILKKCLLDLISSDVIRKDIKNEISSILISFSEVSDTTQRDLKWQNMLFSKNNITYKMLLSVVTLIQDTMHGKDSKSIGFLEDSKIEKLFRGFVFETIKNSMVSCKTEKFSIDKSLIKFDKRADVESFSSMNFLDFITDSAIYVKNSEIGKSKVVGDSECIVLPIFVSPNSVNSKSGKREEPMNMKYKYAVESSVNSISEAINSYRELDKSFQCKRVFILVGYSGMRNVEMKTIMHSGIQNIVVPISLQGSKQSLETTLRRVLVKIKRSVHEI